MLVMPDTCPVYRVMGIDPGTDTLGLSVLDLNLTDCSIVIRQAMTVSGERNSRRYTHFNEVYGDKAARLYAHETFLLNAMQCWMPHSIISEAPFLGRFPAAFAALVECLSSIRTAVNQYDCSLPLLTVDPPTAKKAVGVVKKGSTKDDVKAGILSMLGPKFRTDINVAELDEHSIDSIAVAYSRCLQLITS